jgi:hypothetical protein
MKLSEKAHILPSIIIEMWAGAYPSVTPNNASGLYYKSFTIVIYERNDSTIVWPVAGTVKVLRS